MYLYLKAFHIISVVAWFAGLFYIFRLFVYHVKFKGSLEMSQVYETMEYKLLYYITHPAMGASLLFGILMLVKNPGLLHQKWIHFKFLAVVLLLTYQFFSSYVIRRFRKRDFFLSEKACRMINEVPTLLLIAIVILAVVKPSL